MPCSRRNLLSGTLAVAGTLAAGSTTGCRRDRTTPPEADPSPEQRVKHPELEPAYLDLERTGELARRERKLWAALEKCRTCPRECEVNRLAGESDVCRATDELRVSSAMPHFGEEPPLVGRNGSGTIFFSHCNLRCCFCQNWEIAHEGEGANISHETLSQAMLALQARGCHNVNLVTPSHVVPHILRALRIAIAGGLRIPLVYNTGGYDRLETIRELDGVIDIYMPDFKFQDGKQAHKYCQQADDYPEVAAAAIKEMHRQVGVLQTDEHGVATRGVILRHLVMPNNVAGTDRLVTWVARELSPKTYFNLMAQYRPEHRAREYPEIARRLDSREWEQAVEWTKAAGLTNLARG